MWQRSGEVESCMPREVPETKGFVQALPAPQQADISLLALSF